MKLRVGRRARQQIVRIETWWAEQRPAAPMLFIDELEMTFRRICETSPAGVAWPTPASAQPSQNPDAAQREPPLLRGGRKRHDLRGRRLGCSTRNNTEALKTHRVPIGTLSETM